MRGLRFFLALYAAKAAARIIDLVNKERGTNLPGVIALRIDPQFLRHIRGIDPEKTVFITGTNGKSTTTNLLTHVLMEAGMPVISNLGGANMTPGVAVPLLRSCTLTGKIRGEYVVMETDERYLERILAQIPAKFLCVTNIQKDQVQRNGEPGFILEKIRRAIAPDMTIFINQDEPNALSLASAGAKRVIRFGVAPHDRSFSKKDDFFSVSMPCPVCHSAIRFETYNIDNTGPFRCPKCGLGGEGAPEYYAKNISFEAQRFTIGETDFAFHYNTPQFLYSYVVAAAVARELGADGASVKGAFDRFIHSSDRVAVRTVGGKQIIFYKMKQENSETLQTIADTVAQDPQEKVFLLGCDEYVDFYPPYLNTCFLFDCSFSHLWASGIRRWACMSGAMGHTAALRFLYDGFSRENMDVLPDSLEPVLAEELEKIDCQRVYLVEEIPFWKNWRR